MRSFASTTAAFALLCCASSVCAQDVARGIGVYASFFPQRKAPRSAPPAQPLQAPPQQHADDMKPRVVCGTIVIPPRKGVDAAVVITPPANRKFAIRIIEPQVCRSQEATRPAGR